jgi:chromosome segregation ATPase
VSQAFLSIWQQAVQFADDVAQQSLIEQRHVLVSERAEAVAIEDAARQEVAKYCQQAAVAIGQQQVAERRLTDLERMLEQGQRQIEDLSKQRDGLKQERDARRERIQSLERQLLSDRHDADQARKAQDAYVRGAEERAHREVDRAREETKATVAQLKESKKQLGQLHKRLDSTLQALDLLKPELAAEKALGLQNARQLAEWEARFAAHGALLEIAQRTATTQQARADILQSQLQELKTPLPRTRKPKTKPTKV